MTEPTPRAPGVVAISGAGTGIGQATAVEFARRGWQVVVGGRRVDRLEETAVLIGQDGGSCLAHPLDVTDAGSVDAFFDAAERKFGTVTAVINNAASARYGPLEEFSAEEIAREVSTKLLGSLYMARRSIPAMRSEGRGDLLFITSSAGVQPWPHHLPYAAANAAVEHAARTLRLELEGSGIRITTLRCGETMGTDFATREVESGRMSRSHDLWFRLGLLRHTGLMSPDMVAEAIVEAVTLRPGVQYETLAVVPMSPVGDLPKNVDDYNESMMRRYLSPP